MANFYFILGEVDREKVRFFPFASFCIFIDGGDVASYLDDRYDPFFSPRRYLNSRNLYVFGGEGGGRFL